MNKFMIIILLLIAARSVDAQSTEKLISSPLQVAELIGDRLIANTPFRYRLSLAKNNKIFNGVQCIDFGRTFLADRPATAYAYTHIDAQDNMVLDLDLEHSNSCKIWLNNKLIYAKKDAGKGYVVYDERSILMHNHCKLPLTKGVNTLLVKSETKDKQWRVYMQLAKTIEKDLEYPRIGLSTVNGVDGNIAKLTNWLMIGPFSDPLKGGSADIERVFAAEKEPQFGKMYHGLTGQVTWTIPKLEVLGDVIDAKPWGTNYNWNYHNGAVAWAMQQLSELSGNAKYRDYATHFCDFQLNSIPFVSYQVKTLNADSSVNNQLVTAKLLDFTLAPSLPILYRLRKEGAFKNRSRYETFIKQMLAYAKHGQLRLPEYHNYTRTTPRKYTTWADDMFMGIPFLVQAAAYVKGDRESKALLNDAAEQVIAFNHQVWDPKVNLYMHAHYSKSNIAFPHWSRANGWAIWAMTEVLMSLSKKDSKYDVILTQYNRHVSALAKLQMKNGFWPNVLDHPESREEISGTAIFTMAIARGINQGWLDKNTYLPVVRRGWNAIQSQVEANGVVHNICMGTMCSTDVSYYLSRPFTDDDTHGLLAVLFAAIEVQKLAVKLE